jgi:hypothetical protein
MPGCFSSEYGSPIIYDYDNIFIGILTSHSRSNEMA